MASCVAAHHTPGGKDEPDHVSQVNLRSRGADRERALMAEATPKRRRYSGYVLLAILGAGLAPLAQPVWTYLQTHEVRPHAPDWAAFAELSVQTKIHVTAAAAALLVGAIIMTLPKGRGPHKALGWTWVIAMATAAGSSLFMTGLNGDFYSLIHLISGWAIIVLPMAIYAIRTRNIAAHRQHMMSLFFGALLIAATFAFLPGRFMFEFLF